LDFEGFILLLKIKPACGYLPDYPQTDYAIIQPETAAIMSLHPRPAITWNRQKVAAIIKPLIFTGIIPQEPTIGAIFKLHVMREISPCRNAYSLL